MCHILIEHFTEPIFYILGKAKEEGGGTIRNTLCNRLGAPYFAIKIVLFAKLIKIKYL